MRFFLLLLLPFFINAQLSDPAYEDFTEIESLEPYTESKSFYVVDLNMVASGPGMATLSWDAHKSLTRFMVELYDGATGELFHRKMYTSKSIQIPASAGAVVMPLYHKTHGKAKSTNLRASTAKAHQIQRKEFERMMKQIQDPNDGIYGTSPKKEIAWKWIFRGIGLIALLIGLIAKFAGNKAEFKDYDRRDRMR